MGHSDVEILLSEFVGALDQESALKVRAEVGQRLQDDAIARQRLLVPGNAGRNECQDS